MQSKLGARSCRQHNNLFNNFIHAKLSKKARSFFYPLQNVLLLQGALKKKKKKVDSCRSQKAPSKKIKKVSFFLSFYEATLSEYKRKMEENFYKVARSVDFRGSYFF
jgi:hypothetical protein